MNWPSAYRPLSSLAPEVAQLHGFVQRFVNISNALSLSLPFVLPDYSKADSLRDAARRR